MDVCTNPSVKNTNLHLAHLRKNTFDLIFIKELLLRSSLGNTMQFSPPVCVGIDPTEHKSNCKREFFLWQRLVPSPLRVLVKWMCSKL